MVLTGPISWDDKRPGAYILAAILTGDDNRMQKAYNYCDKILTQPRTPGGLWYDSNLSKWASNRYASNAAAMLAMFANYLPKSDSKRSKYVEFVKQQTDYILGDNPANINYVVGAESNSPKAVHHRGASGTYDSQDTNARPTDYNIFTLWGALAGGPGSKDEYTDSRKNYEMNEVALDYNAGFQMNLAFLVKEGYNKEDPDSVRIHDRSFPKRADTPDITVEVTDRTIEVSTGSNMLCSAWCIEFTTDYKIEQVHDCIKYQDGPNYIICNRRESNFLDGKGTPQLIKYQGSNGQGSLTIDESVVMCDGWHAPQTAHNPTYKPENGRRYKIIGSGGIGNTIPLFEESECWPSFLCGSPNQSTTKKTTTTTRKTTTTTKKSEQTSNNSCFASSLGYPCCSSNIPVTYVDEDGEWGIENNNWCGIGGAPVEKCGDYACCSGCDYIYTDEDGLWNVENGEWCLIKDYNKCNQNVTCTGSKDGYQCCDTCDVVYTDEDGRWGVKNGEWCGIKSNC